MTEFEEYLRGTFEINNGIENDVDTLVRIHAPELLKLAKKELMKDAVEGYVSATIYLAKHCPQDIAEIQVRDSRIAAKVGDKVKVIIIK